MIALEPDADKWIRLESVDSTNSFLLREDLPSGTVVIADRQTQGRGRHGRQWISPEGSLILSGILCFDSEQISDDRLTLFPLLAGVALFRALQKMNPSANPGIKEPNDIIIERNSRKGKVAGILVESEIRGRQRRVIIGVGVNGMGAPETSDSVYPPAALFDVSQGQGPWDRDECARLFIAELNARAPQIESTTPAFLGEVAQYRVGS